MSEYKKTTIVFPLEDDRILLGMKKTGFGEGWLNGFGGKIKPGESYPECAVREVDEEARIEIKKSTLRHAANLVFRFGGEIGVVSRAYTTNEFEGEPTETDEMRPQWFPQDQLPFDAMWPGDRKWIPQILARQAILPMGFIVDFTKDKEFVAIEQVDADSVEEHF